MDTHIREEIKQNLKNSIRKYVAKFSYKSIQPLDLLIPKERKIRSLVGGLETSMGTTVWEPIAETLAEMNGFEIIDEKILKPDPIPMQIAAELSTLISRRESPSTWISSSECVNRLKEIAKSVNRSNIKYISPAAGTGVDIRIKKNGREYAFDTKTVQPNLGDIKGFNKELLEWYAYSICRNPDIEIECKIAYPYNPFRDNFWLHSPHKQGLLEPKVDAVVENEFWDFISGFTNTYEKILSIFAELNSEGFGREISEMISKIHIEDSSA